MSSVTDERLLIARLSALRDEVCALLTAGRSADHLVAVYDAAAGCILDGDLVQARTIIASRRVLLPAAGKWPRQERGVIQFTIASSNRITKS